MFKNACKIVYLPLGESVFVRHCLCGLVYYWCKQACPLLPREKQLQSSQWTSLQYQARIYCLLPFTGTAGNLALWICRPLREEPGIAAGKPEPRTSGRHLIQEQISCLFKGTTWTSSTRTSGRMARRRIGQVSARVRGRAAKRAIGRSGTFCRRGPTEYVVKSRCSQCIEWLCPAMGMRKSAANASRHTPSTASAAKTGEGRRW